MGEKGKYTLRVNTSDTRKINTTYNRSERRASVESGNVTGTLYWMLMMMVVAGKEMGQ